MRGTFWLVCLAYSADCLIWGHSGLLVRISLEGYSTYTAAAFRLTLATILSLILWRVFAKGSKVSWFQKKQMLFAGALQGLAFVLIYYAANFVTSSVGTTVLALQPVVVTMVSYCRRGSRTSLLNLLGACVALIGVFLLYAERSNSSSSQGWAIVWFIISAVILGISYFPIDAAGKIDLFPQLALYMIPQSLITATAMCIEVVVFEQKPVLSSEALPTCAIVYLGTIGSILTNIAFCYVLQQWGTVRTATMDFVFPMVAIVFDAFLEKQSISLALWGWSGIGLILLGVVLTVPKKRIAPAIEVTCATAPA